jgi:hypothetical protein
MKKFLLSILIYLLMACPVLAETILPNPMFTAFDSNGDPLSGGKLYSYVCGTSTAKALYSDRSGTAHANPVVLDANGMQEIYMMGCYKLVLKDSTDATTYWTMDNVFGMGVYGAGLYIVDHNESDQGATGNSGSIKAHIDTISSDSATILLPNNSGSATTTYTLTTSETLPTNIQLKIENGAILDGVGTLTLADGWGQIEAGPYKIFGSSITVTSTNGGGDVLPEYWGALGDGSTDDYSAIQAAIDASESSDDSTYYITPTVRLQPRKVYRVNTGLFLGNASSNTGTRRIVGNRSIILGRNTSGFVLDWTGTHNAEMEGIVVYGHATDTPDGGILLSRRATGVGGGRKTFTNVDVLGTYTEYGVYNYASEETHWIDCVFWNDSKSSHVISKSNSKSITIPNGSGLGDESCTNYYFTRCNFVNSAGSGQESAMSILSATGVRIRDSYFHLDTATAGVPELLIETETGISNVADILVEGSTFHGSPDIAIKFDGDAEHVTIRDSRVTTPGSSEYIATANTDLYAVDLEYTFNVDFSAASVTVRDNSLLRCVSTGTPTLSISTVFEGLIIAPSNTTVTLSGTDAQVKGTWIKPDTGEYVHFGGPITMLETQDGVYASYVDFATLNFATADTQTLWSYTLVDEESIYIRAYVQVKQANTSGRAMYAKAAYVYRDGGSGALIGGPNDIHTQVEDPAGLDMDIDTDTNDVRVRVTNANASATRWTGRIEYEVITN